MTKNQVINLRSQLDKVLAEINASGKLDCVLKLGSCSYFETATFKLEAVPKTFDGELITKESLEFKSLASLYNLQSTDLGRSFSIRGETYTIKGLNRRQYKTPILAERSDGKMFKFNAQDVKRNLLAVTQ